MKMKLIKCLSLSVMMSFLFACNSKDNPGTDPIKGNTIFITYFAGDKGTFSDGSKTKTIPARKGIRWGKRNDSEKVNNPSRGTDFNFNCWNYENGEKIDDATRIDTDINVVAGYDVIVPGTGEGNFDTDSWYQLAAVASKGLANFKSVYNLRDTQIIGKEKNLTFNNQTYKARIIGKNHDDEVSNGKVVGQTCLTFEFTTAIDGFVYDNDSSNSNLWSSSLIRDKLNGEVLNLFEDGIKESVKTVRKTTHKGRKETELIQDPENIGKTDEKIFMLSIKEMGISAPSTFPKGLKIIEEGKTYEYYQSLTTDKLIKKDKNNNALSYLLRSPSYDSYSYVWGVNTSGELGEYDSDTKQRWPYEVSISRGISLCFSI